MRIVVKIGGAVVEDAAAAILSLAERHAVCVVHGAGPQISEEMERFGLRVEFVGGRRVTSRAALVLVQRSLKRVNTTLCRALGARAIGLSGDSIGLRAEHVPELGLVGDPLPCRPLAVELALAEGRIPVVAPLAVGAVAPTAENGHRAEPGALSWSGPTSGPLGPLNVNADEAAAALAVGIGADRILFLSDVPGVYLDGAVAQTLDAAEADRLLDAGELEGGIVPKLRAAVTAARRGVQAEIGETAVVAR